MEIPTRLKDNLIKRGIFPILDDITFDITESIIDWVIKSRPHRNTFTLAINSSGGNPSAMQQFYAHKNILSRKIHLRGVAFGQCGSAALGLLQICDVRYAVDGCAFFIHNLNSSIEFDCESPDANFYLSKAEIRRKFHQELIDIQCRRTGITESAWRDLANLGSRTLNPIATKKALELGLIDRIIPRFPFI